MKYKDIREGMVVAVSHGRHYLHRGLLDLRRGVVQSTVRYSKSQWPGHSESASGGLVRITDDRGHVTHTLLGKIKGPWHPIGIDNEKAVSKADAEMSRRKDVRLAKVALLDGMVVRFETAGYTVSRNMLTISITADDSERLLKALE